MSEARITELEIRVAELERVNEELSQQLVEQWKVVEASQNISRHVNLLNESD